MDKKTPAIAKSTTPPMIRRLLRLQESFYLQDIRIMLQKILWIKCLKNPL